MLHCIELYKKILLQRKPWRDRCQFQILARPLDERSALMRPRGRGWESLSFEASPRDRTIALLSYVASPSEVSMPQIDPSTATHVIGSGYLPSYDAACAARECRRLGAGAGFIQFGANLLTLPPGTWLSQRHWHRAEDSRRRTRRP